jgi:2-C-methyl-D-erythritol 4-phosphate cytidylyltransferase
MKKVAAIIVAAGEGRRFGAAKQFALLKGKTVLDRCLQQFEAHKAVDHIVLVLGSGRSGEDYRNRYKKIVSIAPGGESRQDSVYSGLSCLGEQDTGIVLVHDGVRPLVGQDLIGRIIATTREKGAVIPAIPLEDTIKNVKADKIIRTVDRKPLFRSQTPQGFRYPLLQKAFALARRDHFHGTDEAVLMERMGTDVYVIPGERKNIKITTQEDLQLAEVFIED